MELDRPVIRLPELLPLLDSIKDPDSMLVDRATRAEYGPQNCKKFSKEDVGKRGDLGGRATRITGHFQLGTGLATNGAVLINDVAFSRRSPIDTRKKASLGLVRLKPGVDPERASKELESWMIEQNPNAAFSVQVLSMKGQIEWERKRWLNETPIGMIFTLGVILSFIIGSAIVYMVLATDIASRISEFATLKAMGYTAWFIALIVLQQAWILATVGYAIAFVLASVLYQVTARTSGIPTFMTLERTVGVAILAFFMCTLSGLLAIRKLWKADPLPYSNSCYHGSLKPIHARDWIVLSSTYLDRVERSRYAWMTDAERVLSLECDSEFPPRFSDSLLEA